MKRLLLLAVFICCCARIHGQTAVHNGDCLQTAKTQSDLDDCASQKAKAADVELNRVYLVLLAKYGRDANATAKLKAMERDWVTYRDAYVAATYPANDKQAEYGTMYPMEVDLLYEELTRTQIAALNELLHKDDEPGNR